MNKRVFRNKQQQAGFSLIEIMVAVVISMIAMVVVLQIFGSSETKKRATTGGNDAQMGGALALAALQRDVRQAGYGMSSMNLFGCSLQVNTWTIPLLAPVTINHDSIPDGDANTDTLLVAYGVSNGAPEGDLISFMPGNTNVYAMTTSSIFNVGDWVIAAPATQLPSCSLLLNQVNAVTPAPSTNVTVQTATPGMTSSIVYNLGHDNSDPTKGPRFLAYRVWKSNLTVCDYMARNCGDATKKDDATYWVPIASNIVSLRAQYGRDTTATMDGVVDVYDQALDPADPKFACKAARISAVRMALVARSGDFDKDGPTTAAPVWEGSSADSPTGSAAAPIDLSSPPLRSDGTPTLPAGMTWQNYRYKVFQTVVPIRPTTWLGPQPGC